MSNLMFVLPLVVSLSQMLSNSITIWELNDLKVNVFLDYLFMKARGEQSHDFGG